MLTFIAYKPVFLNMLQKTLWNIHFYKLSTEKEVNHHTIILNNSPSNQNAHPMRIQYAFKALRNAH